MVGKWWGPRCALTPPDPQLKGAWRPDGFKPLPLNINPGFKTCLSNGSNLRRYKVDARVAAAAPPGRGVYRLFIRLT
jgi:hypothetical protein